jgi:hypothetical protein
MRPPGTPTGPVSSYLTLPASAAALRHRFKRAHWSNKSNSHVYNQNLKNQPIWCDILTRGATRAYRPLSNTESGSSADRRGRPAAGGEFNWGGIIVNPPPPA